MGMDACVSMCEQPRSDLVFQQYFAAAQSARWLLAALRMIDTQFLSSEVLVAIVGLSILLSRGQRRHDSPYRWQWLPHAC